MHKRLHYLVIPIILTILSVSYLDKHKDKTTCNY